MFMAKITRTSNSLTLFSLFIYKLTKAISLMTCHIFCHPLLTVHSWNWIQISLFHPPTTLSLKTQSKNSWLSLILLGWRQGSFFFPYSVLTTLQGGWALHCLLMKEPKLWEVSRFFQSQTDDKSNQESDSNLNSLFFLLKICFICMSILPAHI